MERSRYLTLLILLVLAVGLLTASSPWVNKVSRAALDKSPPVLIETARRLIADLGYTDPPADSLFAFSYNDPYYEHVYRLGNDAPSLDAKLSRSDHDSTATGKLQT